MTAIYFCNILLTNYYLLQAAIRQTKLRQRDGSGLTNSRAANWAPEVEFSPLRALSLQNQPNIPNSTKTILDRGSVHTHKNGDFGGRDFCNEAKLSRADL